MARRKKEAIGGGRLERTQTVTVRIDPQTRYLAELAARKQRRTLSSYIEWWIAESLKSVSLKTVDGVAREPGDSISEEALELWDAEESDRFQKLANRHPDILTHGEQTLQKLIAETREEVVRQLNDRPDLYLPIPWHILLRENWQYFEAVARGEMPRGELLEKFTLENIALEMPEETIRDRRAEVALLQANEIPRDVKKAIENHFAINSLVVEFQRGEITQEEFTERVNVLVRQASKNTSEEKSHA